MRAIDAREQGSSRSSSSSSSSAAPARQEYSSKCEQNWSNFSFKHSDSWNRLTTSRACKLVWLCSNLHLAERTQSLEQGPQAQAWEFFSDDEERQGSDADDKSSDEK